MNLLLSSTNNPYWNLATEEFLLKNSDSDYIFLYVNKPTVVVGKHQIVQKEINASYIEESNILIARRLSGGGTVFHDEGNLNFSFLRSNKSVESVSYKEITQSIFDFLHFIGIDVSLSERNDFMLKGKKVSGSAMHIFKNRQLAHNTLLVNCDLNQLSTSLAGNAERFRDKSIPSVRSKVMNLVEVKPELTVHLLTSKYTDYLQQEFKQKIQVYTLTEQEKGEIGKISSEKYSTTDWIYNYSPKYIYRNSFGINDKTIAYTLEIEKGIILSLNIELTNEIEEHILLAINSMIGTAHNYKALLEWFNSGSKTLLERRLFASLF